MRAVIAATAGFAFGGPIGAVAAGVAVVVLNPVVIVATGYALGGPVGAVAAAAAAEPQAAVNAVTTAAGSVASGVSRLSTVFFDPSNNNHSESDEEKKHDPKDKTHKLKVD